MIVTIVVMMIIQRKLKKGGINNGNYQNDNDKLSNNNYNNNNINDNNPNNDNIDNEENSNNNSNKDNSADQSANNNTETNFENGNNQKFKPIRTGGQGRFQRIPEKVNRPDQNLEKNHYDYSDPYAVKAHKALVKVKGKNFTKEKNKKKKNTFHGGGPISFDSNSFKFND